MDVGRAQNHTYPAQDSIESANAAVARDIVSSADWKLEHEFKS